MTPCIGSKTHKRIKIGQVGIHICFILYLPCIANDMKIKKVLITFELTNEFLNLTIMIYIAADLS